MGSENTAKPTARRWRLLPAVLLTVLAAAAALTAAILSAGNRAETQPLTRFRRLLDASIEEVSRRDGKAYVLDEDSYNEFRAKTYVAVMAETEEQSLTSGSITENFWGLFEAAGTVIDGTVTDGTATAGTVTDGTVLRQKDALSLVLESGDISKMARLDYTFMGVINDGVIARSKGLYISQFDSAMADISYGTSNVRRSGCGPISLVMAVNYVCGRRYLSLQQVVDWANENNIYVENQGTSWALLWDYPPTVGVPCRDLTITDPAALESALGPDEAYVVSMHRGHFTENGHFIVITGVKDGKVSVLDPASISRSLTLWDAGLIIDESNKHFWRIGRPDEA